VAEVDTVEVADRERARRARRGVGETSKYLHGNLGELSLNGGLYGLFRGCTSAMAVAGAGNRLFAPFLVPEMEKSAACRSRQRFIECNLARIDAD
jgi:hypothetical protein